MSGKTPALHKAIDDYTSGRKTAQEVAKELGIEANTIYRWKTVSEEKAKGLRVEELMDEGHTKAIAKKLPGNEIYQSESELTGLINTTKKLDRKRKPRKS